MHNIVGCPARFNAARVMMLLFSLPFPCFPRVLHLPFALHILPNRGVRVCVELIGFRPSGSPLPACLQLSLARPERISWWLSCSVPVQ
jgi:hypothetical protein